MLTPLTSTELLEEFVVYPMEALLLFATCPPKEIVRLLLEPS